MRHAVVLAVAALCACKDSGPRSSAEASSLEAVMVGQTDSRESPPSRMFLRTGTVLVVVRDVDDARARIEAMVAAAGGYVSGAELGHADGYHFDDELSVRIPAAGFTAVLGDLRQLGEVILERIVTEDITANYADLEARRDAAVVLEKRLLELAANRTGTVEEILAVERELARVRGEVEQHDRQLRSWDDHVALSALTISLREPEPKVAVAAPSGFRDDASGAFARSMAVLKSAGSGAVLALISILPWLPLLIPALVIGRHYARRWRARLPIAVAYPLAPGEGDQRPQPAPSPP